MYGWNHTLMWHHMDLLLPQSARPTCLFQLHRILSDRNNSEYNFLLYVGIGMSDRWDKA